MLCCGLTERVLCTHAPKIPLNISYLVQRNLKIPSSKLWLFVSICLDFVSNQASKSCGNVLAQLNAMTFYRFFFSLHDISPAVRHHSEGVPKMCSRQQKNANTSQTQNRAHNFLWMNFNSKISFRWMWSRKVLMEKFENFCCRVWK